MMLYEPAHSLDDLQTRFGLRDCRAGVGGIVAGVTEARLTHPEKILYPECGVTKKRLFDYYARVAVVDDAARGGHST